MPSKTANSILETMANTSLVALDCLGSGLVGVLLKMFGLNVKELSTDLFSGQKWTLATA
jgi:hypothetical protein